MKAKKSLGQHFLRSDKALKTIIDTGDLNSKDIVLEIGPGEGVLTQKLLEICARVIAVEKDDFLFELLKEKFNKEITSGKLELIHRDILDFDIQEKNYKLVANIPYNITGAIIRKFLSLDNQPQLMVLLVQKEVAERIVAKDGKESLLSISVKLFGEPKYVEKVLAGSFVPAPRVDSAIISIKNISRDNRLDEEKFFSMLHAGFQSKRKKLTSNLSEMFPKIEVLEAFQTLNLSDNTRAEEVSIETWRNLAQILLKD